MDIRNEELMAEMSEFGGDGTFSLSTFANFHEAVVKDVEAGVLKLPTADDNSDLIRDIALDRMFLANQLEQEKKIYKKTPLEAEIEFLLENELDWNLDFLMEKS